MIKIEFLWYSFFKGNIKSETHLSIHLFFFYKPYILVFLYEVFLRNMQIFSNHAFWKESLKSAVFSDMIF